MFTLLAIAEYNGKAAMRDRLHWRILNDFATDPRLQFAYPTHRGIFSRELSGRPDDETLVASSSAPPFPIRRAT